MEELKRYQSDCRGSHNVVLGAFSLEIVLTWIVHHLGVAVADMLAKEWQPLLESCFLWESAGGSAPPWVTATAGSSLARIEQD